MTRRRRRAGRDSAPAYDARYTAHLLRLEWTIALLASVIAIALYVRFATHAGALWRDEINSVNTQRTPTLAAMWRLDEFESFPLLWPLMLRGWMRLDGGASDAGLRLFGVLAGLTLPAAVWHAARRTGARAPLASLALLAVNPEIIRWGSTVRPWGLGAALGIVAIVWLGLAAMAPTRRTVALAALAAVLSVHCLYQNAILLAAGVAGGAVVAIRRRAWGPVLVPLGIGLVAALSLLPYLDVIERRARWNMLGQVPLTMADLVSPVVAVVGSSGPIVAACWIALLIGTVGFTAMGRRQHAGIYWGVTLALSGAMLAGFYLWFRYAPQSWYFLGLAALAPVAAEAALRAYAPSRTTRGALAVVALVALGAGIVPAWAQLEAPQTNVDDAAARINAAAEPGDLVVVNPWYVAITFARYYHGRATLASVPPIGDHTVHRYDLVQADMLSEDPVGPLLEQIRQVLVSGHRVWYVGAIDVPGPGSTIPVLPPPPLPDTGWAVVPYQQVWSLEVGTFLYAHVTAAHRWPIAEPGGPLETTALTELRGWH